MKFSLKTIYLSVSLLMCSSILVSQQDPMQNPNLVEIGDFFYTEHALERMDERDLTGPDVSVTIKYGNHYRVSQDKMLCIDPIDKIAVYYNPKNNIVITVMREAIPSWIKSHTKKNAAICDRESIDYICMEDYEAPLCAYKGKSSY